MDALDGRTPVLVGVGQLTRHIADLDEATEPVDMMAAVLRAAADDAGPGAALLARATGLRVVDTIGWRYADPCVLVADRLGIDPPDQARSATGGNGPQILVNEAASAIQAGDHDVVLICGAEAVHSWRVAKKQGQRLPWTSQPADTPAARVIGLDRAGSHEAEQAVGVVMPVLYYPLFENALRGQLGRTVAEHTAAIAGLWSRFSHVAATNPHAWQPEALTPEQIADAGPANRMVGFPYPKLMNANIQVDMAAALILCSVDAARAAGVPEDRWVFPLAGTESHDHWFVSERDDLCSSPSIAANGRVALELAGLGVDDVAHVDLYSCFPVAVEVGARALGLGLDDPSRPLTQTGGLTFGGGPGNNYVTHSIAALADTLRRDPGSVGLATANGWFLTKHALGLWSTMPPAGGFRWASTQDMVDATPSRQVVAGHEGPVTLEAYTVLHERDGAPGTAYVSCLLADGRRAWGTSTDPDLMAALETEDVLGSAGALAGTTFSL